MNIKTKFTIVVLTAIFLSLALTSTIVSNNVTTAMETQLFNKLDSIRENKKQHIEDYFSTINKQILTFSEDDMIVEAMAGFKQTFHNLDQEISSTENDIHGYQTKLNDYYQHSFAAEFKSKNGKETIIDRLMPKSSEGIIAQYLYIANNTNPLGAKHELNVSDDISGYSKLHGKYHPIIRNYLEQFEYYDILLIDPDSGHIVYSVFKELDYGTSLLTGPYNNTNIAEVFKRAVSSGKKFDIHLADFKPYLPSYNAPASFISSPIFKDDKLIGVLMFQMPIGKINTIMQEHTGMGETGESYLVGEDKTMRSQSRFTEDNTILDRIIDTAAVKSLFADKTSVETIQNYMDKTVLSAFSPLQIKGINWGILVEINEDEGLASVSTIQKRIIIVTLVIILLLIPLAIWFVGTITKPIVEIVETSVKMSEGHFTQTLKPTGKDEVAWLTHSMNQMQKKVVSVINNVNDSIEHLTNAAGEIGSTSKNLSQSTSEQAASVEQTSASIEQMSAGISQNNENSKLTNTIATESANDAIDGGERPSSKR